VTAVRCAKPALLDEALELAELVRPTWPAINARIDAARVPTCHVATPTDSRARFRTIEVDIGSARSRLKDAQEALTKARASQHITDTGPYEDKVTKAAEVLAALQQEHHDLLESVVRDPATTARPSGDAWDAGALLASQDVRDRLTEMAHTSKLSIGRVGLGEIASPEALAANFGSGAMAADVAGTPNMRRGDYAGILPQLHRPLSILDLLPTATTDQNSIPYTQEGGSVATAAETAEGAVKPEAALSLADVEAKAATIAHWLKNRKQVLADHPALQGIIEGRLRYGVLRRLEGQVLSGDGTGENIRGILQTSGIGAVTFTTGALVADQILRGITSVTLADAQANAIVCNPLDWQTVLLAKTSGSGEYINSDGPFGQTFTSMWGVPLIVSPAVAQGTALVGDFRLGAQLFIREGVSVLLSDSDSDDFVRNRVTILAEMRAALAVYRPSAFTLVALQ
jgi:hypothetical protein